MFGLTVTTADTKSVDKILFLPGTTDQCKVQEQNLRKCCGVGCGGWARLRTREGGSTVRAEPQKALGGGGGRVKKYTRERKPLQGICIFPVLTNSQGLPFYLFTSCFFFFQVRKVKERVLLCIHDWPGTQTGLQFILILLPLPPQ